MAVVVHLSPVLVEPASVRGGLAIVIDVLRASTTIATALAAGAREVWACAEVDEARAATSTLRPGSFLLGGERGGVKIDGFDLGNSPAEYRPDVVRDKTIVFSTTNGTMALRRAAEARGVMVGAFVNLGAVVAGAAGFQGVVHVLCAGVSGRVCMEDVLCAGAIARGIERATGEPLKEDAARLAAGAWDAVAGSRESLTAALRVGHGGRNLEQIGLGSDIDLCAAVDSVPVLPELAGGRLVLRTSGR